MNNLVLRGLTGLLFIASIILPVYFDWRIAVAVFLVYYLAGAIEYANLFKNHQLLQLPRVGFVVLLVVLMGISITSFLIPRYSGIRILLIIPVFIFLLTELWRNKREPILNLGVSVLGVVYLFIPFLFLIHLVIAKPKTEWISVLGMFFLIWTNDTFAYLTGRFIGKTKLFERISPKKTWEGTIGGIVFTFGVSFLIFYVSGKGDLIFWLVSAALIAPSAILGDLLESLMKRNLNIKDSGTILPGHGGILDRFDAALFAIPFYYCWYMLYTAFSF